MVNLTIRLNSTRASSSVAGTPNASRSLPGVGSSPATNSTTPRIPCGPHLAVSDLPLASGAGEVPSGAVAVPGISRRVQRRPGEKVHFCVRCNFPIAIYGRLDPCEHVFCLICARKEATCYLCEESIVHVQKLDYLDGLFVCGAAGCLRSFLSKSELEWHIRDTHFDLLSSREAPGGTPNEFVQPKPSFGQRSRSPSISQVPLPQSDGWELEKAMIGALQPSPSLAAAERQGRPYVLESSHDRSPSPFKQKRLEFQQGSGSWEKHKDRDRDGQKHAQRDRERGQRREEDQALNNREHSQRERGEDRSRDLERDKDRDRERSTPRERDRFIDTDRDGVMDSDRERTMGRSREKGMERDRERGPHRDRDRNVDRDRERAMDRDRERESQSAPQSDSWDQRQQLAQQQGGAPYPLPTPSLPPAFPLNAHQSERLAQVPPNQQGVMLGPYPPQPFPPFHPPQQDNRNALLYDASPHGPFLDPRIPIRPDFQGGNARDYHLQQDSDRARNVPPQLMKGYNMGMDRQGHVTPPFPPEYGAPPPTGMMIGNQPLPGMNRFLEGGHGGGQLPPPPKRQSFGHGGEPALGPSQHLMGRVGPANFGGGPSHPQFMNWPPPQ